MTKYRWLNAPAKIFLERDYLLKGQTPKERIRIICERAGEILGLDWFADAFEENIAKGWYSLSTPIWTNFGTNRGLPISCFGSQISDSMDSIIETWAEVCMMTKIGGGTSAYFGHLRQRGAPITDNGTSSGSVHFMQLFDMLVNIVSQGKARRGNFAAYLPIEHPDIEEFLKIRSEGSTLQEISSGVTITDKFMEEMLAGDKKKRKIWASLIKARINTGYPYIVFIDTVNKNTVDVYKDKEMKITHSNLCSEIMLPDSETESFVCDLSSMNLRYYDEWKDTNAVELLTYFLDAVMSEFIEKASKIQYMERAVNFAKNHRALGIGMFGWHSLLQSKMIPYESMAAQFLNTEIAETIRNQAYAASAKLAKEYGEPELLKGYGRRNTTLMAIAPTKSSSFIIGQESEAVEPNMSNYMIKDLQKGKFTIKNPFLEKVLDSYGKNTPETWESILKNSGSVQHLDFLHQHEKEVFKTFEEISPKETIIQAAQRQKYIDQGQSLNLMIHPSTPAKDISKLYIEAWQMGIKSLYYQFSINASQNFAKNILHCKACE